MSAIQTWEPLSYVVTVVGLPLAIYMFIFGQRKERDNEEEEVYQLLSGNHQEFLKIAPEYLDFIVRARPSAALRRCHEGEAVKTLAFAGRLHGRMVQPRRFSLFAARLSAREDPEFAACIPVA
jgi:hypothetical protein